LRVAAFDQGQLPVPIPLLDPLFPKDGGAHVFMHFEPDEAGDLVLGSEALGIFSRCW
jgi:hypothetical protein